MTRVEAWLKCREMLVDRQFAAVAYQRSDGEGRVVIGCRQAGEYLEVAIPAGYDEFELMGRMQARTSGQQWGGTGYRAALERERIARERAERKAA